MKRIFAFLLLLTSLSAAQAQDELSQARAKTRNGQLEGVLDKNTGVRSFKGIPFAAPPVGDLRWKEPQPVKNWTGVRKADKFGPRAMQRALFGDMGFRSDGVSEDCLYLNVWTPANSSKERLPVLVYFYGGGLMAGDGSEPRYDGESMAQKGIVSITVNYRLTVFGFFSHPELSKESPTHSSGNYGFLDQYAALKWVQENVAAFGGDPKRVTIAGESAGSISVNAQMVSPLSQNLFSAAIGESGSMLGTLPAISLTEGEQIGTKFAEIAGAKTLAELRAIPAEQLLEATAKPGVPRFMANVDNYFFPKSPMELYTEGMQSKVPLLVGWNSEELGFFGILGKEKPTKENYEKAVKALYNDKAEEVLKLYPASTDEDVAQAATNLSSDRFIGFSTWKWSDLHSKTGKHPVYRYMYDRPRPAMRAEMGNASAGLAGGVVKGDAPKMPPARGAVHSAEIEYALGNLASNKVYDWTADDYKVSKTMQEYFANFIKTHNPNGKDLPKWPAVTPNVPAEVMHLNVESKAMTEKHRDRYLFIDQFYTKPAK